MQLKSMFVNIYIVEKICTPLFDLFSPLSIKYMKMIQISIFYFESTYVANFNNYFSCSFDLRFNSFLTFL